MKPTIEIVLNRFKIDDVGRIIYKDDIIGGNGTILARIGQPVAIKRSGTIEFRISGVRYSLPACEVSFVLYHNKFPHKSSVMQIVIKPNAENPSDYRYRNLIYTTNSDIQESGKMRVSFCNGWQAKRYMNKTKRCQIRYFHTKEMAERFSNRLHRWMLKAAYRDFWRHVGIDISTKNLDSLA